MDDATLAEAIIARAWQQLDELTRTGMCVLESGMLIRANDRDASTYINTLRALARLKPPKGRRLAIPDDFRAPDTRGLAETIGTTAQSFPPIKGGEAKSTEQPISAHSAASAESMTVPVPKSDVAGGEGTQVTASVLASGADRGSNAGTSTPRRPATPRKKP